MEKTGFVKNVIFKSEDTGYAVFTVECEDGDDIFVGSLFGVEEGLYVSAEGEYVDNPRYGVQFKFSSCMVTIPEDEMQIEMYLGSGMIKGIGQVLAKRIVKHFGRDALRIIDEDPLRLAEVNGISERKAQAIAVSFNERKEMQDAIMFLVGNSIPLNLAIKIYNEYGQKLYKVIQENPYKIAEDIAGIGFKKADEIANTMGIAQDSDFRIRAAILYVLLQSNAQLGHMYLPQEMLVNKTYSLLVEDARGLDTEIESRIEDQIFELAVDGKLVTKQVEDEDMAVYSYWNYQTELHSARMLCDLDVDFSDEVKDFDKHLEKIEKAEKITLEEMQRQAIFNAMTNGVAVVTGGPGTGKTTIINVLIQMFEQMGMKYLLAAPTGRAAKRITDSTDRPAQTIHRMLELSGGMKNTGASYTFAKNQENPLDVDVIIVDEVSMMDAALFYSLLQAITVGTRLILVGDKDQLPSVGAGNVLKDIIKSDCFSVTVLSRIYRQEEGSGIVTNAHKINAGQPIELTNKSTDFFFMRRNRGADTISVLKELLTDKLPKYFHINNDAIQVLTPMRMGELGVENLNKSLQNTLNPARPAAKEHIHGDKVFRAGDKVMQIKNNYDMQWYVRTTSGIGSINLMDGYGVFNGDMGVITNIDDYDQAMEVKFDDGRMASYSFSQLDELEHAYAITIHKSQGSEYPVVVLPLFGVPPKLQTRNLLYTAVTRAKKGVVIVGDISLLERMIQNANEAKRYTSFAERLTEIKELEQID